MKKIKTNSTIVAISTPPGLGGVGMVRLSGSDSLSIAEKIFHKSSKSPLSRPPAHRYGGTGRSIGEGGWTPSKLYFGIVQNPKTQENVDDGFAVFFKSPHSFTGEDVVEFHLHGNPFLLSQTIELCLSEGAKQAQPGEFTKRAYLNGKMDLLQAEAVSELIHSQSVIEARQARMRLDGKLSSHLEKLRDDVIDVLAEIEADVDFPEEDIDPKTQNKMMGQIQSMTLFAKQLLQTYGQNQKISSGFRIALVGKPNVGKSSLFNAILQNDRAIVTPIAGTTRDVLSEEIILDGYRVKFFDTAGLRNETKDEIEKEGILRSAQEISKADLVWWIGSAIEDHSENEFGVLQSVEKNKRWLIWNKIDLKKPTNHFSEHFEKKFQVSASTGEGVGELLKNVKEVLHLIQNEDFGGGISNDRQKEFLEQVIAYFSKSIEMIQSSQPPELTAVEFRQSYYALNRILGKEENMEAVYDRIFSKFCVGK